MVGGSGGGGFPAVMRDTRQTRCGAGLGSVNVVRLRLREPAPFCRGVQDEREDDNDQVRQRNNQVCRLHDCQQMRSGACRPAWGETPHQSDVVELWAEEESRGGKASAEDVCRKEDERDASHFTELEDFVVLGAAPL